MTSNVDHLLHDTLTALMQPGQVFEIRIPKVGGKKQTDSGYFDNADAAVAAVLGGNYARRATGVYITINPVNPALLARAANRMQMYAEATTSDDQIVRRRWLPVDIDPVRPSGISSTNEEHDAAHAVAQEVIAFTTEVGWPAPIYADSGNGATLLYPIDVPNTEEHTKRIKQTLEGLAQLFNTDAVVIDTSVHNAARIMKFFGTLARKGDNTSDRPHRRSRLLDVPPHTAPLTVAQMQTVAVVLHGSEPSVQQLHTNDRFDVNAFLERHQIAVSRERPYQGGTLYQLAACPWNSEHKDTAHIIQFTNGALHAGCFHNSCKGAGHNRWRDLRGKYELCLANGQTTASQNSQNSHDLTSGSYSANSANSANGDGRALAVAAWTPPFPFYSVEVPHFPVDALPPPLQKFAEALAEATQTPVDVAAMLLLVVLAVACQKKLKVKVKDGYYEPLSLFVVVSQPPGSRKSAVFKEVTAPLVTYERAENERRAPDIAAAQSRYKILSKRLDKAQLAAAHAASDAAQELEQAAATLAQELTAMRIPTQVRLIADDTTPERLASLLHEQGGRAAVLSPEGDVFENMAGRYATSGTPNIGVFLKGHAGDSLRVDRVGRPAEYVHETALTMGLTVQPEVIHGLTKQPSFHGRGLLGRFLYALPQDLLGRRNTTPLPVPSAIRDAYHQVVRSLLALPFGTDEQGESCPHTLQFDQDAQQCMQQFETWVEPQLALFEDLGTMRDWGSKLVGAVTRIAALLHMAAHPAIPSTMLIEAATVKQSTVIGRYLIAHARAAYAHMGAHPRIADAEYVLAWIGRKHVVRFTKRDLFESTKGRFKEVAVLDPVLHLLIEHGFIREVAQAQRRGPGQKPSPCYEVNPLYGSQNSHTSQHGNDDGVLSAGVREDTARVLRLYGEGNARARLRAHGVPLDNLDAAFNIVRSYAEEGVAGTGK